MKQQKQLQILKVINKVITTISHYTISLLKKLLVISTTLVFSWIVFSFIFEELYFISIPLTLYTTYGIHTIIKYHTKFYDIPYDDEKAYYEAVEKYERDRRELVYGELVEHGPINTLKNNFKVWFDFSGMTQQFNNYSYQDKKLVA